MGDFDFEFGTWDVRHRRLVDRLSGNAEWEEFDGTAECRSILGGRGCLEEASMPAIGARGCALRLQDVETDQWSIHWASTGTGRLEPPVVGAFDGSVGTFLGEDVHAGRAIRVRFVWDQITPDSARWTQACAWSTSEQWETNWVMEFTRTGPA